MASLAASRGLARSGRHRGNLLRAATRAYLRPDRGVYRLGRRRGRRRSAGSMPASGRTGSGRPARSWNWSVDPWMWLAVFMTVAFEASYLRRIFSRVNHFIMDFFECRQCSRLDRRTRPKLVMAGARTRTCGARSSRRSDPARPGRAGWVRRGCHHQPRGLPHPDRHRADARCLQVSTCDPAHDAGPPLESPPGSAAQARHGVCSGPWRLREAAFGEGRIRRARAGGGRVSPWISPAPGQPWRCSARRHFTATAESAKRKGELNDVDLPPRPSRSPHPPRRCL